jgi:hypothetical protein
MAPSSTIPFSAFYFNVWSAFTDILFSSANSVWLQAVLHWRKSLSTRSGSQSLKVNDFARVKASISQLVKHHYREALARDTCSETLRRSCFAGVKTEVKLADTYEDV